MNGKRGVTAWLACGAALLAGLAGAGAGAAAHPADAPGLPSDADALQPFIQHSFIDDPVAKVAVLIRKPAPSPWDIAWVTESGRHCFGILWPGDDSGSNVCDDAATSPLAAGTPRLMVFGGYEPESRPGHVTAMEVGGFVRGAADVSALWDGVSVPVTVVPLGLAGDPTLSALLVVGPPGPAGSRHTYSVVAHDASGAELPDGKAVAVTL
jgi:hypothetical protein